MLCYIYRLWLVYRLFFWTTDRDLFVLICMPSREAVCNIFIMVFSVTWPVANQVTHERWTRLPLSHPNTVLHYVNYELCKKIGRCILSWWPAPLYHLIKLMVITKHSFVEWEVLCYYLFDNFIYLKYIKCINYKNIILNKPCSEFNILNPKSYISLVMHFLYL